MTKSDTQLRSTRPGPDAEAWRKGLLARVGYVYIAIFAATIVVSAFIGRPTALFWFGAMLMVGQSIAYLLQRLGYSYRVRAWTAVSALVAATATFYVFAGLNPGPVLAGAFTMVLTALLLGRPALIAVLLLMFVFLIGIAVMMWAGMWPGPAPAVIGTPTPDAWARTTVVSTVFWAGIAFSALYVVNALQRIVVRLREKERQRLESEKARREAEAMAVQMQKLEAVGQLAAGIAHEFNNSLLVLQGWNDILRDTDSPELQKQGDSAIAQAIDQGAQLAKQLLTFGHKQVRDPRYLPLAQVAERAAETLGRLVSSRISLRVDSRRSGFVFADESQLQQVILNLVINARDAIADGGEIIIRLREPTPADIETVGVAGERDWIVLEVEDNGIGMDEETRQRIFEPFFTTKEIGKGTGLGLSTVFGIVRQSDAHISVWSEPGRGSRFAILFPRYEVAPDMAPDASESEMQPRGPGRVLVLEDDPLSRELIVVALTRDNLTVIETSNGDDALDALYGQNEALDILCTDAVFPGPGLGKVIAAFEQVNPDGQVLICSGYVSEDVAIAGMESGHYEQLNKPFTAEQLTRKIQGMLARQNRRPIF